MHESQMCLPFCDDLLQTLALSFFIDFRLLQFNRWLLQIKSRPFHIFRCSLQLYRSLLQLYRSLLQLCRSKKHFSRWLKQLYRRKKYKCECFIQLYRRLLHKSRRQKIISSYDLYISACLFKERSLSVFKITCQFGGKYS